VASELQAEHRLADPGLAGDHRQAFGRQPGRDHHLARRDPQLEEVEHVDRPVALVARCGGAHRLEPRLVGREDRGRVALERDDIGVVEGFQIGSDQGPPVREIGDDLGILFDIADRDRGLGELHEVFGPAVQPQCFFDIEEMLQARRVGLAAGRYHLADRGVDAAVHRP
jgi:hypothetical protein